MPNAVPQQSFAAGELSPSLYARTDLAKYKAGAATLRTWFCDYRGGASTRAGTRFIALSATGGSGLPPRLIRFQFSTLQSYVLEFGDGYLAFYKNGAQITSGGPAYTIVSPYALADLPLLKVTQSADVMTLTHPSYAPMYLKRFADTNWTLTAINFVPVVAAPSIITVRHVLGTGGGANSITLNTTYRYVVTAIDNTTGEESLASVAAEVDNAAAMSVTQGESVFIQWTPVANAGTYKLYRQEEVPDSAPTTDSIYGLLQLVNGTTFQDSNGLPDFTAGPPEPSNPFGNGVIASIAVGAGGASYSSRTVVRISSATGSGFRGAVTVSGGIIIAITVLNGGFGYLPGDTVIITDPGDAAVSGASVSAGGQNYKDINYWITDPTGFGASLGLTLVNGVITGATASGGHNYTSPRAKISSTTGSGGGVTVTIGAPVIGSGASATFTLSNPSNYPGCSAYFVQRQWFAASNAKPENFWASKIGVFTNFTSSFIVQGTDAITATVAATEVNAIKALVPMPSGLVAGTAGGAFLISGGGVGPGGIPAAVSPSDIVAQPQASNGFSDLPPLRIGADILFQQSKGSIIRDLSYNFYVNIYTGTDLTVLSNHLFAGRAIIQWGYAEEPYKIVWCVRDDGILLGFTYFKEQEVYAWTPHDTDGLFCSVCTVSEPPVDATYFVVQRVINGNWAYCIERMADRSRIDGNKALGMPANIEAAWCVDCGLSLAQRVPGAVLSVGAGANVAGTAGVVFSAAGSFSGPDVGSVIRANCGRATVTDILSADAVHATITAAFAVLPNDPGNQPIGCIAGSWTITAPVTVVSGLDHLDGLTVAILADGNVMPQQVVAAGSVTLSQAASNVVVGLPYQCQLQTLNIDTGDGGPGGTIQGKQKKIGAVSVSVKDTRGLKAGRTPATVVPVKEWNSNVNLGGPLPLVTGLQRIILDPLWEQYGRVWLQVDDPVPATCLGVVQDLSVGG